MALDVFLSIPGIPGESQDAEFPGTIATPNYQWALQHPETIGAAGGGGGAGKTTFQPLTIQKNVDKASPLLMQALTTGKPIAAMTLLVRKAGGDTTAPMPFLIYEFETVLVSAIQDAGSAGGEAPTETVTFDFGVSDVRYRATNPDGSLSSTVTESKWSVITNSVPTGPGSGPGAGPQ